MGVEVRIRCLTLLRGQSYCLSTVDKMALVQLFHQVLRLSYVSSIPLTLMYYPEDG